MTMKSEGTYTSSPTHEQPTVIDRDRRRGQRIRLDLETLVPVLIRGPGFIQRGLARNVSEGGMLIECERPPSIGSQVEIRVAGIKGSLDAPDAVTLHGEVRHQLFWHFRGVRGDAVERMNAIGIRFVEPMEPSVPPGSAVH